MPIDKDRLYRQILERIGNAEIERVKVLIGSRTLRDALQLIVEVSESRASLFIPHYWAVYYHDGRGSVSPVSARKLVFFDDPLLNDPRLGGRYPKRESETRRLTKEEYEFGLERNAERHAAGQDPFMYVVDAVGPAAGKPFFDQLANNAANRAEHIVREELDREIQRLVDEDPDVQAERDTAFF